VANPERQLSELFGQRLVIPATDRDPSTSLDQCGTQPQVQPAVSQAETQLHEEPIPPRFTFDLDFLKTTAENRCPRTYGSDCDAVPLDILKLADLPEAES